MPTNVSAYPLRFGLVTILTVCASPVRASVAYIANCCQHGSSVSVFDTGTRKQTAVWSVGADAFAAVFAPDGETAYVSSSISQSVTELQVSTGAVLATIQVGFNVQSMAITPDGNTLIVQSNESVTGNPSYHLICIATQGNIVTNVANFVYISGMALSPDGLKLYAYGQISAQQPEGLLVLDPGTFVPVATVPFYGGMDVGLTPDGKYAYVPTLVVEPWTINVTVVDTPTNKIVATIPLDSKGGVLGVSNIGVSPDGSTVLVSEYSGHDSPTPVVGVIQTKTNHVVGTFALPAKATPGAIVFSPDGKLAYITGNNVVVDAVNVASMKTVSQMTALGNVSGLAISPDGKTILCPNSGTTQAAAVNQANGATLAAIPLGQMNSDTTSAALLDFGGAVTSPDGTRVYMTNDFSGNVSIVDTASKTTLASIPVCFGGVGFCVPVAVAVSPDGTTVYVANLFANYVTVIDSTTFATKSIRLPKYVASAAIAVTPDGSHVYVAGNNSPTEAGRCASCYVFDIDVSTGQAVASIAVPFPKALTVSPDGTKVYVVGNVYTGVARTLLFTISTATDTITSTLTLAQDLGAASSEPVVAGIAITADGQTVFADNWQDATVWQVDVARNKVIREIMVPPNAGDMALTPDGTEVWVSAWQASSVFVIDAKSGAVKTTIPMGNWSYGIAFAPQ
jgi:YVTN family beta-propeller protein